MPYTTAIRPAAIASHSQLLASIGIAPPKTSNNVGVLLASPGLNASRAAKRRRTITQGFRAGTEPARFTGRNRQILKSVFELALHEHALDPDVIRQAVRVRRIGLAGDQRLEVLAARRR